MCCMSLPSPEFCFVFLALPHFLTSKTVGFLLFVCLFYSYQNPFLAMYPIANIDLLRICVNKNGAHFHVSTLELQFFKEQCMVNIIIIKCSLRMKIFSILPWTRLFSPKTNKVNKTNKTKQPKKTKKKKQRLKFLYNTTLKSELSCTARWILKDENVLS